MRDFVTVDDLLIGSGVFDSGVSAEEFAVTPVLLAVCFIVTRYW
jgi:hypothetical protein